MEPSKTADKPKKRISTTDIRARKRTKPPLVCLTAYTAQMAALLDPHVEMLLVGDSVAMVIYGRDTTLGTSLGTMIAHGQAVMRGAQQSCVMVDLPFGSYEASPEQAFASASRVLGETGCAAVKLEGGVAMADTVRFLVSRGVPVVGHIGLTPQHVNQFGGFRVQGRGDEGADRMVADAIAIAEAGAFAIVVEGVPAETGHRVTEAVDVPTIGIGAGPACDGQILVTDDMLGLFTRFTPKFVKQYAKLHEIVSDAAAGYAADVRAGTFPDEAHSFK